MAVEVAGIFLHCSQPPLSPSNSLFLKTLSFACHTGHNFLGTDIIHRSHQRRSRARVSSIAGLNGLGFVDDGGENNEDEFVKRINNFAPKFKMEDVEMRDISGESAEIKLLSVEQRLNCLDLPLSLRILKQKKKQCESAEMSNSAYSSVKKAFSSMVFIMRELQSHTIRLREVLFSSNLHIPAILNKVHEELHASFVWLFQQIFSATPTLMIYLMLLLVNFTVFSITDYPSTPNPPTQSLSSFEESRIAFDSSAVVKSFSVGGSGGGGGGGGKKAQAVAGAADDFSSSFHSTISSEGTSADSAKEQDDEKAWKGIVEEAERITASVRPEVLMDSDTLRSFVSPVTVRLEPDDLSAYAAATELLYRRSIAEGMDDSLILSNFAQFLYVVIGDHDRAEEYFKRAAMAEPRDPEALSRYANFLWVARKDLTGAEETFLEAIEADPGNSYYSANYAHFLWSTGGDETCYPLD